MIKNYYHDEKLRKSMSKLAKKSFGLDFELLYQKGYWDDVYSCYGILDNEEVVSNVSFHQLILEKDNEKYNVVSIGSVMTYESHRGKGYARMLMEEVLKDHDVDAFFLGANETVTEFYPRFGFKPVKFIKYRDSHIDRYPNGDKGKKLDLDIDLELIEHYVKHRVKNSKNMYVYNDDYLKMFYMLYLYRDNIYLVDDAIIVCDREEDVLYVHDIYMLKEKDIYSIVGPFVEEVLTVDYSFEVKLDGVTSYEDEDAYLFVRTDKPSLLEPWSYPSTSTT